MTEIFQTYARGEATWRAGLAWEHVPFIPPVTPWFSTWWAYTAALLAVAGAHLVVARLVQSDPAQRHAGRETP